MAVVIPVSADTLVADRFWIHACRPAVVIGKIMGRRVVIGTSGPAMIVIEVMCCGIVVTPGESTVIIIEIMVRRVIGTIAAAIAGAVAAMAAAIAAVTAAAAVTTMAAAIATVTTAITTVAATAIFGKGRAALRHALAVETQRQGRDSHDRGAEQQQLPAALQRLRGPRGFQSCFMHFSPSSAN
jgi:hypothetical protein